MKETSLGASKGLEKNRGNLRCNHTAYDSENLEAKSTSTNGKNLRRRKLARAYDGESGI
jgi:hypothetical protein